MFWEDDNQGENTRVSDDVIDLAFSLNSGALPVDHAYALSTAVKQVLPWIGQQQDVGLHLIHGADTGNGWQRPEAADEIFYISRRTKLVLRLPKERVEDARILCDQVLDINGYRLDIGKSNVRLLSALTTIYARYIVTSEDQSENNFMLGVSEQLQSRGIRVKKALSGKSNRFKLPNGWIFTRSLMLADISIEDSIRLQREGLGSQRSMGCGLFIPHKSINHL